MVCPHLHLHSANQTGQVTHFTDVTEKGRGLQDVLGRGVVGGKPATSLLAAVALRQLLAIGTGVNHLVCILAHPDRRAVGVRLLGFKRAMQLDTVAAALTMGWHEESKKLNGCEGGGAQTG